MPCGIHVAATSHVASRKDATWHTKMPYIFCKDHFFGCHMVARYGATWHLIVTPHGMLKSRHTYQLILKEESIYKNFYTPNPQVRALFPFKETLKKGLNITKKFKFKFHAVAITKKFKFPPTQVQ